MHFHSLAKLPSPPFLSPSVCTKELQIHVNINQSHRLLGRQGCCCYFLKNPIMQVKRQRFSELLLLHEGEASGRRNGEAMVL